MALIGNFGFESLPDDEFLINFEIPNNCNVTPHYDATKKLTTITIQLNSGQSQPSSIFVSQSYTVSVDSGEVNVNFEQKLNGTSAIRPKVRITEVLTL